MEPSRQAIIAICAMCDLTELDACLLLKASINNVFIANLFFRSNGGKIPLPNGILRIPEHNFELPLRLEHLSYADREAGELFGIRSTFQNPKRRCGVNGAGDEMSFREAHKRARRNDVWLMVYVADNNLVSRSLENYFRENHDLRMQVEKYFVLWQTSMARVTETQLISIMHKPQISILDPQSLEVIYTIKPCKELLMTQLTTFLATKKPYSNLVALARVRAAQTVDFILRNKQNFVPMLLGVSFYRVDIRVHLLDSAGEKDSFTVYWPVDTHVGVLQIYIEDNYPHYANKDYALISGFPRIFIRKGLDRNLAQMGLYPSINLHVDIYPPRRIKKWKQ